MSCERIRDALQQGRYQDVLDDDHLTSCAGCALLAGEQGFLATRLTQEGSPTDPALWGNLNERINRERGVRAWLRSRPTPWRVALAAIGAATLLGLGAARLRADFHVHPKLELVVAAALLVGGLVLCLNLLVSSQARPEASLTRHRLVSALGLALPIALALLPAAHQSHPESLAGAGADFWARATSCFVYGSVLSAPWLALLWGLERADLLSKRRAVAGFSALGLLANAALLLHCPITHVEHRFWGHSTIGSAFVLGGTALIVLWGAGRGNPSKSPG